MWALSSLCLGFTSLIAKDFVKYYSIEDDDFPVYNGEIRIQFKHETEQMVSFNLTSWDHNCTSYGPIGVNNSCGVHVHEGRSCSSDAKGHYYQNMPNDPWLKSAYRNHFGTNFVLANTNRSQNEGRTFLIHSQDGSRISCAILQRARVRADLYFVDSDPPRGVGNLERVLNRVFSKKSCAFCDVHPRSEWTEWLSTLSCPTFIMREHEARTMGVPVSKYPPPTILAHRKGMFREILASKDIERASQVSTLRALFEKAARELDLDCA
jgi:hypothetical protein